MKEYRMSVNLSSLSNSAEDRNNLPLIQIIQEGQYHRTIGIEQLIERIIEIARREESRQERISVSRFIRGIRSLFPRRWRRIFNRFSKRNILFRLQIWDSSEPGSPPLTERRGKRRRSGSISDEFTTPDTQNPTPSQEQEQEGGES